VPAHNEEDGISPTLLSLEQLAYPVALYRVIVIADNCTDRTAEVVTKAGHECWVRTNTNERGKGQALQWAIAQACDLAFDAIVVLDADTEAHPALLAQLDRELAAGALAAQVRYDFSADANSQISGSATIGKIAENNFFWRPRHRLGLAVFIQGNGFCLSRKALALVPWSAGSVVEDIEYSLHLAMHQVRVAYVERASVVARTATSHSAATPQRLRWASGTIQIIFRYLPRILKEAARQHSWYLAECAFALLFLSRMLLGYLSLITLALSCFTTHWTLALRLAALGAVIFQLLYLSLVLRASAGHTHIRRGLLGLPFYLGWLVLTQGLALLGIRRNVWTRTVR
jgi:cellulose synthase/poly-beta-1,6-N-acetylglucosamine synthase-like glycosyltransferase